MLNLADLLAEMISKMSSNIISLDPDTMYDIGGKIYTLKELRQHAINSELYCKMLNELKGEDL